MNRRLIGRRLTGRVVAVLCSRVVGVPIAVLVLCLAGVLQFRQSRLAGVPDIGHPFDVEEWGYIEVDPAENAYLDYESAARLYRGANEPSRDELEIVWERGWSEASPAMRAWLEDNRAALDAWRAGTEKDIYLRVQPAEMTVESFAGSISDCRAMLRLALLEAARLRSLGNTEAAWAWHCATLRYSHHQGMNDSEIGRTTAADFHYFSVRGIVAWTRDDSISSDQLAEALADVREADSLSSKPSACIRAEYFIICDDLLRLEEHREDYDAVADWVDTMKPRLPDTVNFPDDLHLPARWSLFLQNEPELTRRLLRHQVVNLLEFADEPLSRQPDSLPGEIHYFDVSRSTDPELLSPSEFRAAHEDSLLARFLLNGRIFSIIYTERARQGLLELLLAAEWYRRETGEFPVSIDELLTVPMLDEIPLDALSRIETPLRYERAPDNPQRAKVWSVGRNGVDDGGSLEHVFVPSPGRPDLGYWIGEPESTPPD